MAVTRCLGCCAGFQKKAVAAIARMRAQAMASPAVHLQSSQSLFACVCEAPVAGLQLCPQLSLLGQLAQSFGCPLKQIVFGIFA